MSDPALLDDAFGKSAGSRRGMRRWRDLWAIEQNPRMVELAQSVAGRAGLLITFAIIAKLSGVFLSFVLVAAACAWLPKYRNWIVLAGGIAAVAREPGSWLELAGAILLQEGYRGTMAPVLSAATLAFYFACALGMLLLVRRHKTLFIARHPVISLLGLTALLCAVASSSHTGGLPRAALWTFLSVFTAYLWFLAYAIADQRSREPGPVSFQMGILEPFWGSTTTPFGKGAAFLRKHQARTDEDLAVTQLKGLKLLFWALLLMLLNKALVELLEVRLGIPKAEMAYVAYMQGAPLPVWSNWASLVWATFGATLKLAIWGHKIIAVARLAGFRLPRNTWRPLESRTLAEFWNRYYYYFKELLVEFFFFPTFLRVFRKHPRLRVFFATFMAAGVGNALYHFIRDLENVAELGLLQAIANYTSYLFYCAVLATGIGISQARSSAGRKPMSGPIGTLWSALCVWGFVVCLHVFGDETRIMSLRDRFAFFASLFGF